MKQAVRFFVVLALVLTMGIVGWAEPQLEEKSISVFVHTTGPRTDKGWNQNLYEAYVEVKNKYPDIRIEFADMLPYAEHLPLLESRAREGTSIIYGSGAGFEAALALAPQYPNTWFVFPGFFPEHLEGLPLNIKSYCWREEQGGYLAGVLAGMLTKSNKVGNVAGVDYPNVVMVAGGFGYGARSVNPDISLSVVYTGSFTDVKKGYDAARIMADTGVDVIISNCGDGLFGVIDAAKEKGVYVIGNGMDQREFAPKLMTTSFTSGHETVLEAMILDYMQGKSDHQVRFFGAKENATLLFPLGEWVPAGLEAMVEEVRTKIASGEVDVPVIFKSEELARFK